MTVIHSADFAREKQSLAGEVDVSALSRLHDQLADREGRLAWRLAGGVDRLARPVLHLAVSGELHLVCQRCLKAMTWPVAVQTELTQFLDEATLDEAEAQDEDLEGILVDAALDVEALVEEEVLLAVPFAPRHDACGGTTATATMADEPNPSAGKADKPNPFAVLATLKTRKAED
ncbi:YceD family protein [Chitiniphilus eburneus]|uniref:Large ribosomal RNA subunit accumulation protein YceD n=1 Tax=Chitiniphilus eburneus TaxID=2571148 RepID=A0A4U0Q1J5_9NEIS|nr:YceD family protein [Chitiniphilus eburneus]TJZ74779.1 hypothetical protein FAZ21_07345 [Chitiniphilus eburneus]